MNKNSSRKSFCGYLLNANWWIFFTVECVSYDLKAKVGFHGELRWMHFLESFTFGKYLKMWNTGKSDSANSKRSDSRKLSSSTILQNITNYRSHVE